VFVHRGVVEASAILVDEALGGPLTARRRVVAAWAPGVTVHRLALGGGALLVRFPAPRWIDCVRAPGLPLVRMGPSPAAPIASAPLTPAELAALAPAAGAAVIVRSGAPECVVSSSADLEDPAGYLDVSAFAPIAVTPLGPAPAPPLVTTAPHPVEARRLLGVAAEPAQLAEVLEALRAARTGAAPPRLVRPSWFAALFATLTALVSRLFSARGRAEAPGGARGGAPSAELVVAAQGPRGPSVFQRFGAALRGLFASALVRASLAPFLGRRQAEYLDKMFDMFERGDLSEALRHAIPLADGTGGGTSPPMLGLPTRRSQLAISGGGGSGGPTLYAPESFYEDLCRRYRAAFEQLEREGRIEEAAYVLAELLRESAQAVAFLERHGRYRLAAEIAEARGLPPAVLVRQWLLAGDTARAVLLARRHGAFADALARLENHPQGPVLRLLWGGMLADAGDFAAAVEVVWPIPEARRTAEVWIDAAIAQGGGAAARMLAKKLSLVPAAFPDVRERALALLEDAAPVASSERRAFAEGLLAEGPSAGARTLARAALRALVRDGGRTGDAAPKLLVERLEAFAGDEALRADRPVWPTVERTPFSQVGVPLVLSIAAGDTGVTPVHDAAHLPDGRTVLALGEAGVRVLGRHGRPLFALDQPAHRLVVSDRGDRALALARRGDAWRIARIDLVGRRSEVWCEARFDCAAADFDGSQWVVTAGGRLLVIDALEQRFDALASLDLCDRTSAVHSIARSPSACVVALEQLGVPLAMRRYDLPGWTLRQRAHIDTPRRAAEAPAVLAAGVTGTVALLAGPFTSAAGLLLFSAREGEPSKELHFPASPDARPLALQLGASWTACAFQTGSSAEVRLFSTASPGVRARIHLDGAGAACVRLAGDKQLTVADDRGRVLVMELDHGALVHDGRV
jgi:hypothetical protein